MSSATTSLLGFWALLRRQQLQAQAGVAASKAAAKTEQQLVFEQTKLAEASSFMAMLLHELKTPLSVIRLAALTLRKLQTPTARTDTMEVTLKRLASIQQSVDSIDAVLLSVGKTDLLEQGSVKIHKTQYDLVPWLEAQMAQSFAGGRVRLELPHQLLASVDPSLLSLMLRNLVRNATTYSPAASVVTLRLTLELAKNQFCIEVENAIGTVGRPDAQQVFQKYYRSDKAHHSTGTGLGLYWVHGVAKLWGGDLRYCPPADTANHDAPVIFQLRLPC